MNDNDLDKIVWDNVANKAKCELRQVGDSFLMDDMPFHLTLEHLDKNNFIFEQNGKKISFMPYGYSWDSLDCVTRASNVKGLKIDTEHGSPQVVHYKNIFDNGISIDNEVSKNGWKKIVKITNRRLIESAPSDAEYIEFIFEIETDFEIKNSDGLIWNREDELKFSEDLILLGDLKIDSIKAWYFNDLGEKKQIVCSGSFYNQNGVLFFKKKIPVSFLKNTEGIIYTDISISYGTEHIFNSANTGDLHPIVLSKNSFLIFYFNATALTGLSRIGTVVGTTVSWSSEYSFGAVDISYSLGACLLDSSSFIVFYKSSVTNVSVSKIGTISGGTISFGNEYQFSASQFSSNFVALAISSTVFVVTYRDGENSQSGSFKVGSISGGVITYGARVAFDSGTNSVTGISMVLTSSSTFIIVWVHREDGSSTYSGYVKHCSISGTTVTQGGAYVFATDHTSSVSVIVLSSNRIVLGYTRDNGVSTYYGNTRTADISGLTITLNSTYLFKQYVSRTITLLYIDDSSFSFIFYDNTSSNIFSGTASIAANVIDYEDIVSVHGQITGFLHFIALTPQTNVAFYKDTDTYGKAIVVTNFYGTKSTFGSRTSRIVVEKIDTFTFILAYQHFNQSGRGEAIIATIVGTKITYGSIYIFRPLYSTQDICLAVLTSTSVLVTYHYYNGTGYLNCGIVLAISGTVITWGSEYSYGTASSNSRYSLKKLTSTTALMSFNDYSTTQATSIIATISGSVITWGSKYNFYAGVAGYTNIALLSPTSFSVVYTFLSSTAYAYAIIGTISGTAISYGSPYLMNATNTSALSSAPLSETSFVASYYSSTSTGVSVIATVSGTVISFSSPVVFSGSSLSGLSLTPISPKYFILAYIDPSNNGVSKILKIAGSIITYELSYNFVSNGIKTAVASNVWAAGLSSNTFALGCMNYSESATYISMTMIGVLPYGKKINGIMNVRWNGIDINKWNGL